MIEIKSFKDGYFVKVNNEVLELTEERVSAGEWREPLDIYNGAEYERAKTLSKLSFHKLGDIITEREDFDQLAEHSLISNGDTVRVKQGNNWLNIHVEIDRVRYPQGEWMVVTNAGP